MKLTLMTRDGQKRGKEKIIREATRYTRSYRQRVNIKLKKFQKRPTSHPILNYAYL